MQTPFASILTGVIGLGICACATHPPAASPSPVLGAQPPTAPAEPVMPQPLFSEYRAGRVVQKVRVVYVEVPLALEIPAFVHSPKTRDAQALYASLRRRSPDTVFLEMVTVPLVETAGSFYLKPIEGNNAKCSYAFKPRRLNNDQWQLGISVAQTDATDGTVKTSIIMESGTIISLGGCTKTAPKSGKTDKVSLHRDQPLVCGTD